jgi:hypothetical protein
MCKYPQISAFDTTQLIGQYLENDKLIVTVAIGQHAKRIGKNSKLI